MDKTASPSAIQSTCLPKKRYGCWKRSSANIAEALYTITALTQTRNSIVVNRTRSDFNFRANQSSYIDLKVPLLSDRARFSSKNLL
jgi:hypothetical protein